MNFIKQMKKREFIEMGLKTLAAILAAFLAIILMEGMIYSIELNALKTKGNGYSITSGKTIAYCIEQEDDKYFVVYYNEGSAKEWSASSKSLLTKQQCLDLANPQVQSQNSSAWVKEVHFNAPNAFKFSITPTHYIVMAIFIAGVAGFFVYKFFVLAKEYKTIEENFKKTGTIEIG
ncbi:MAG: hypothetical protein IKY10_00515 [Clostridia bacterium]|nr:hypothetical protein [Clostridia bacterium]